MAANNNDTKLQVNFKLSDGTLINLYANSQKELEEQLQSIADLANLILLTGGDLSKGANVAYATKSLGLTQVEDDAPAWAAKSASPAPAAPAGANNTCKHGEMIFRQGVSEKTGKPWKGYFCPSPKGTPDQCSANFVR